jgi:hypothetical protein
MDETKAGKRTILLADDEENVRSLLKGYCLKIMLSLKPQTGNRH